MAPGGNKAFPSSTDLKNIKLPSEIKCRNCQKIKPTSQFSNKQLNDLRFKISMGFSADRMSSNIRCRLCTGNQSHELKCNGPCRSIRSLDDFSKCQRRMPDKAWCFACIAWKEAMEPGVTTLPPPNNELSPDEERVLQENEIQDYDGNGPEGDPDSDYDDDLFNNSMAALGVDGQTPFVRNASWQSASLELDLKSTNTKSSLSNPFNQSTDNSASGSAVTEVGKAESSLLTSEGIFKKPSLYSAWDDRKYPILTPSSSSVQTSAQKGSQKGSEKSIVRRGGWAKPGGQRRQAPEFTVTRPTGVEAELDSEDESESDIRNVF